ncbi:MAG: Mu-like prophage major head subunit gpT family protein [Elusimicrobiales bacterium]
MIVNKETLAAAFAAFNTIYQEAFGAYTPTFRQVAMEVPSTTKEETYAWLGSFPKLSEWIGERQVKNLKASKYSIVNKDFESTVAVPRNDIEDDKIGLFKPMFAEMARSAAAHPDETVFGLLVNGFTELCYDGLPFFSAAHKVGKATVSNMDVPANNPAVPWFLLDTSRAIKPLVYQNRKSAQFTSMTDPESDHVFKNKEFLYGVDSRDNVGFGLWQLGWGCKKALDSTSYAAARAGLGGMKNENGVPLGVKGTLLVVGPSNEAAARKLLTGETLANGESNPWKGTAELMVCPWMS